MNSCIRIVQVSDIHLGQRPGPIRPGYPDSDQQLRIVLEAVAQGPSPDLLLLSGDLAEVPIRETYDRLLGLVADHLPDVPVLLLAGNHDDPEPLAEAVTATRHTLHGEWTRDQWQLIGLDSHWPGEVRGRLVETELNRLERALERHSGPSIVALHHPPVVVGSAWIDPLGLHRPEDLLAVLDRHPQVRACVFGHIHQEFHDRHRDVHLLGCPATCVQFAPNSDHFALDPERLPGYRILELHADTRLSTRIERVLPPQTQQR